MIRHIKKILLCLVLLWSCEHDTPSNRGEISHPTGELITVDILRSDFEKARGLSGVQSSDFPKNKGAFFYFPSEGYRNFWMPDTYFNLDIIYLDKNLKIVEIHKDVPSHPGHQEPIPRMESVWCQHVLEVKSSSAFSKKVKVGDVLKGNFNLEVGQ